jgi:hypothetical protein
MLDTSYTADERGLSRDHQLERAAREITVWLCELFARWKIPYNRAVADDILRDRPVREALGGSNTPEGNVPTSSSSHLEVDSNELLLDPFTFSNRFAPEDVVPSLESESPLPPKDLLKFRRDMRALLDLERTLQLLRSSDPESWSTADRMSILCSLMDKIGDSHALKVQRLAVYQTKAIRVSNKIDDIPDEPTYPLHLEPVKVPYLTALSPPSLLLLLSSFHRSSRESYSAPLMLTQLIFVFRLSLAQVSSRSNVRCHFSGAEAKYIDASAKWVAVPDVLLSPPVYNPLGPFLSEGIESDAEQGQRSVVKEEKGESAVEDTPSKEKESDKRSTRVRHPSMAAALLLKERPRNPDQAVALETAVLKVAAAREFAFLQLKKVEERLSALCTHLPTVAYYKTPCDSDAELNRMAPWDISRGNPLGRDKAGNEYWLLFAQRRMPIIAQGHILALLNNTQTASHVNPQVIMRDPSGLWSVHSGQNITDFINSFTSSTLCEHYLRENIIESLHFAKKSLISKHLAFKSLHLEWVERHSRAESFMKEGLVIPPELDVPTAVKRLETLWAKFVEIRCMVHNGNTFRQEAEITLKSSQSNERLERDALQRKLKKMKDNYQEEIVEHHPLKGWYRFEPMGHLRELWCATSADRMHADPMVCQQMVATAKRSKFLSTLIPYIPPVAAVPVPVSVPAPVSESVPGPIVAVAPDQGQIGVNHTQTETLPSGPLPPQSQPQLQSSETQPTHSDIIVLPSSSSANRAAVPSDDIILPVSNAAILPSREVQVVLPSTFTESPLECGETVEAVGYCGMSEEKVVLETEVVAAGENEMEVTPNGMDAAAEPTSIEIDTSKQSAEAVVEEVTPVSQEMRSEEAVSAVSIADENGEAMQVEGSPNGELEANDDVEKQVELEGEGEGEGEAEGEDKGMGMVLDDASEDLTRQGGASDLEADSQSVGESKGLSDWNRQAMTQRDHHSGNSENHSGYHMSARVKIRNSCANKVDRLLFRPSRSISPRASLVSCAQTLDLDSKTFIVHFYNFLESVTLSITTSLCLTSLPCYPYLFTLPFLSSPCPLFHSFTLSSPSFALPLSLSQVIEQLHILTNEVLRVYPSGSIAASFLNVSQVRMYP